MKNEKSKIENQNTKLKTNESTKNQKFRYGFTRSAL
jgi:hypothetical protein